MLFEYAGQFADISRIGAALAQAEPDMLAARRAGMRSQVMDTEAVEVCGEAVRIATSLIGAKTGRVEVEREKPKAVVHRACEIDRPWIVRRLLRHHHACAVLVCARWVDPDGPARRPLMRKCLI